MFKYTCFHVATHRFHLSYTGKSERPIFVSIVADVVFRDTLERVTFVFVCFIDGASLLYRFTV